MQGQTSEDGKSQILIVDGDEATRRILDLSLRNAGFVVGHASGGEEAARKLAGAPDLLIATVDDEGLTLCRQAKQSTAGIPPAVVLISDPDLESKRRGLEAGADDFVARPIYVQEVVSRARALLQRRERERIEMSAQRSDRFVSAIEDVPLVDLLRAIALNQKSGVTTVVDAAGARGEIFFRQGRVVDAEVGRLSGRDAVYRLFCWPSGRLEVEWKSIRRKDTIEMPPQDLLMEALRRVDEWRRLLSNLPALDTIFEVDYRLLAERLADIPDEVNRILRLFDGMRTLMQVIDDCGLPDLDAVAAIGKLCRERIIHDVRVPIDEEEAMGGADMEGWLSDAAGPFRSPARMERDLFGVGPGPGFGVHGRPTAPLDPLGDGARDALDDDMRSRFTDRLQAEAQPIEPVLEESAVPLPVAIQVPAADSGPADGVVRPTTLPGMGASAGASASEPARAAAEMAAQPAEPPPIPPVSTTTTTTGSGPSALPLSRAPRSASGEIVVKKTPIKMKPSADVPLPRGRSTDKSPLPFIRPSQTTTPPGSARALDELPPLTDPSVVIAPQALERVSPSSLAVADRPASADADDLGASARAKGIVRLGVVVAALVALVVVVKLARGHRSAGPTAEQPVETAPPPPSPPSAPVIEPIAAAPSVASAASPAPGPTPIAADLGDKGASGKRQMAVAAVAAQELDERSADPKLARARAAEAGTLLGGCHAAVSDGRLKDAEAACTAAKDANPDSAEAYGLLAHALYSRNRRHEALGAAEKALKLNPKWADAYVIIGGVHQDAGETGEAKRAYERYLELDPKGQYAPDLRAIVGKLQPAKL
jgi:CheY-like chemotaxis protein